MCEPGCCYQKGQQDPCQEGMISHLMEWAEEHNSHVKRAAGIHVDQRNLQKPEARAVQTKQSPVLSPTVIEWDRF